MECASFIAEMRFAQLFLTASLAGLSTLASAQAPATKDAPAETRGMAARTTPGDYQAQAKCGDYVIAAEFKGHSIPTATDVLMTEDYAVVEIAIYGPAGAHAKIAVEDFNLKVNGKKSNSPGQPFGVLAGNLKDPEWEAEQKLEMKEKKESKSSVGVGGQGQDNTPAIMPKMPVPMIRAMMQRAQKVSMVEGDRPLPQAGLVYFPYHGKAENVKNAELSYQGNGCKTTLKMQP